MNRYKQSGWHHESDRHRLAALGYITKKPNLKHQYQLYEKGKLSSFQLGYSLKIAHDWTQEHGLREIIANALDTDTPVEIYFKNGKIVIQDVGKGIEPKHFLIGVSEAMEGKKSTFGEGFKAGIATILRKGGSVTIESVGRKSVV